MILFIDTTNNLKTVVKIGEFSLEKNYSHPREQELVPLIKELILKHKLKFSDITEIEVNNGPGSFTGTRVGVAVANALAWSLKIKVNGSYRVMPIYEDRKETK